MTNREKLINRLSQWSSEDFAYWFNSMNASCEFCIYSDFNGCEGDTCLGGYYKWLESEADEE